MKAELAKGREHVVLTGNAYLKSDDSVIYADYIELYGEDFIFALCKYNVKVYPDAYNTYDSLGEAYMKLEKKELAIQNYKKSLELNPNNSNALIMLEKLNNP